MSNWQGLESGLTQSEFVASGNGHGVHTVRPLLPIVLALVVLRGSLLPWITVRMFSGDIHVYNLTNVRGGISIVMTIVVLVLVSWLVMVFNRTAGMTMMSLVTASLGWMAAISGMFLGIASTFLPSIKVAGLDLTRASIGQGSGVAISVLASLWLAFLVVRQFDPLNLYAPAGSMTFLPLVAMVPLLFMAVNMHAEWMRLGTESADLEAIVAGDSLYGSGLVVLVLWLAVGLWIAALVVQRTLVARVAGAVSVVVSLVVVMYALFLSLGGRALTWLIPNKIEKWAAVHTDSMLYMILFAAFCLGVIGFLAFSERIATRSFGLSSTQVIGKRTFHSTDLLACMILGLLLISLVYSVLS